MARNVKGLRAGKMQDKGVIRGQHFLVVMLSYLFVFREDIFGFIVLCCF